MTEPLTLCRPHPNLACFRCCPPIRPAGYDHLDHRADLTDRLAAATAAIEEGRFDQGEIDGRSCWGLGFLDQKQRLIGCLLHPLLNSGRDRRGPTGYAEKCARETCPQADLFAAFPESLQNGLVELALAGPAGQDSFTFSSPATNPLWRLILWGGPVLTVLQAEWAEPESDWHRYLADRPEPRARAFLLEQLLARRNPAELTPADFERRAQDLIAALGRIQASPLANAPFVHRLGLDRPLADFIRLGLNLPRLEKAALNRLIARLEELLSGWD